MLGHPKCSFTNVNVAVYSMRLGLQSLARLYLGAELDKSSSIRCSDWEAELLTPQQVSVIVITSDMTQGCRQNISLEGVG